MPDVLMSATLAADSAVFAHADQYRTESFVFSGDIPPGGRVMIDPAMQKVTINAQNARNSIEGTMWPLWPGANGLRYVDTEAVRNLSMFIHFRDRFI